MFSHQARPYTFKGGNFHLQVEDVAAVVAAIRYEPQHIISVSVFLAVTCH